MCYQFTLIAGATIMLLKDAEQVSEWHRRAGWVGVGAERARRVEADRETVGLS